MSNRERAYQLIIRVCQIPVGSPEFNAAVYAAELAFEAAITDQTAALRAALEELAKVKQERDSARADLHVACQDVRGLQQERDGLAAALHGFRKELDNESDIDDEGRPNVHMKLLVALDALHEDGLRVIAAHDRKVAAGVLRAEAAEWRKSSDITYRAFAAGLIDSAEEYESGEREVPGE